MAEGDEEQVVRACAAELQPALDQLASDFRKREYLMVLQHYDMLLASPALEQLASVACAHGSALEAHSGAHTRALAVSYTTHLYPDLAASAADGGGEHGARGDTCLPQPPSPAGAQSDAHMGGTRADDNNNNNNKLSSSAAAHVDRGNNSKEYDDDDAAVDADVAAARQLLSQSSPLLHALYEARRAVELAWGSAVLAAVARMPDEYEHYAEMVEEYERLFACTSPYLHALAVPSMSVLDVLSRYSSDGSDDDSNDDDDNKTRHGHGGHRDSGRDDDDDDDKACHHRHNNTNDDNHRRRRRRELTADVVLAAVERYFANATSRQLAQLVVAAREAGVRLTLPVAELLERCFVRCMKDEDAEDVFDTMTRAGVAPRTTRPFAMLFNAHTCRRVGSVLDYYELMLHYGIVPESSTWRILCKACAGINMARLHFTIRQKVNSSNNNNNNSEEATSAAHGSYTHQQQPHNNNGNNSNSNNNNNGTGAVSESRRRDERAFYVERLYELTHHEPTPPLLEAMKVVHRAQVEGTSLRGNTHMLSILLRFFCNGTTPRRDLVEPFARSAACRPVRVRPVIRLPSEGNSSHVVYNDNNNNNNGSDVSKGDAHTESNKDSTAATSHDTDTSPAQQEQQQQQQQQQQPSLPPLYMSADELASPAEEAAYVLRVFAQNDSLPNNRVLTDLVLHFEGKGGGIGILEQVTQAMFALTRATHGAAEPVRCFRCHILVHYYVRRRMRVRIAQLLRSFCMQYYEYAVLWAPGQHTHHDESSSSTSSAHVDDATVTHPGSPGSASMATATSTTPATAVPADWDEDYVRNFMSFATAAMKIGPLDWALGLFTLALIVSTRPVVLASTRVCLLRFNDADYRRTGQYAVITALEQCEWNRNAILRCDDLILEPHEQAAAAAAAAAAASSSSTTTTAVTMDSAGASAADENVSAIYTTAAQEHSSYTNPRAAAAHPTLCSYLSIALREMGVERHIVDWYKQRLREQRKVVFAHLCSSVDTKIND